MIKIRVLLQENHMMAELMELQATTALKQEIVRKTNEKLRRVIVDDYVEIESIDRYIKLKGRDGASEGQTLSIAYCFLGTLFEDSGLLVESEARRLGIDTQSSKLEQIMLQYLSNNDTLLSEDGIKTLNAYALKGYRLITDYPLFDKPTSREEFLDAFNVAMQFYEKKGTC